MSTNMPAPTRLRLVTAAAEAFRRQGYAATGIKSILAAANASHASLYHFFPGGKAELGRAVIESGGGAYLELVQSYFCPGADPVTAAEEFFASGADLIESTGFVDACPIATIAGEIANTDEPMRVAAQAAFESWMAAVATCLRAAGAGEDVARSLSVELFCLAEGALLAARVSRNAEPIRQCGHRAVAIIAAAMRDRVAATA